MPTHPDNKRELEAEYWKAIENISNLPPSDVIKAVQATGRTMGQVQQDIDSLNRTKVGGQVVIDR